jgi:hypothetical protein
MAFEKKASRKFIFHKDLAALGPVRITVDGKWRQIKSEKCKFGVIDITVKEELVSYWCENEACARFWSDDMIKTTFTIIAAGSRDDATIARMQHGSDIEQPPARQEQPHHQDPPPQFDRSPKQLQAAARPAPVQTSTAAVANAMKQLGRAGSLLELAADQTLRTVKSWTERHGLKWDEKTQSDFVTLIGRNMTQTTFTTLFIDSKAAVGDMPTNKVGAVVEQIKVEVEARRNPPPPEPPKPKLCPKCGKQELDPEGWCPDCDQLPE